MKELSIEEKAHRYDEALKVLHKYDGANIMFSQSLKEEMFHELKESEDEKIVNALIGYIEGSVHDVNEEIIPGIKVSDAIAWLEKQGEQKPAWSEEDETIKNNIRHIIRQYDKISKRENQPCNYIGDCLLWMQNIKDRVQSQLQQEWSEEDDAMLEKLITAISQSTYTTFKKEEIKDWLKSLRPQGTWKPSKEQMNTLLDAIGYVEGCNSNFKGSGSVLENLYNDLKKLKEEIV